MTEHNDPILQEALNDLADIQFCDNDHNQAVEEERQCENIIVVMASMYAKEIEQMKSQLLATAERNGALELKNARYKAALEVYADPENWCNDTLSRKFENIWLRPSDGYDIAREALEADK